MGIQTIVKGLVGGQSGESNFLQGGLGAILSMAAPGIIGGISQIFGKKRRTQEEDAAMNQIQKLSDMYSGDINQINERERQSFLDNPDVQAILTELQQNTALQTNQINNQAAVTGMTEEGQVASMGRVKDANAQAMARIMGGANQYRNMLFGQKQMAMRGLAGTTQAQYQAGQQNRANFNNSMSNILQPLQSSINAAYESGGIQFGKKK